MQYLFVYGTLRTTEGHPMHNYMRGLCDFMGSADIGGIKVELEGGYPGLLLSGNPDERVEGELYRIHENKSDELFDVLDRYEGCHEEDPEPREYFRHRCEVKLLPAEQEPSANGAQTEYEAWVYLYAG